MTTPTGQTPAGWYPDQTGQNRYWDGQAWTEHIAPTAPTAPPVAAPTAAAPPKGGNWFLRHKVLSGVGAGIIAIAAIGAATSGGTDDKPTASSSPTSDFPTKIPSTTSSSSTSTPAATTAKPAPLKPQIGQHIKDGKFQFTVTKVKKATRVGGQYLNKKAQGQFILVYVTVKNIGNKAQTLDDSSQYLFNSKGQRSSADSAAGLYANTDDGGDSVFFNEINPGNQVKGVLVFDVAKSFVPSVIEVHDSPFSGGAKIRLR